MFLRSCLPFGKRLYHPRTRQLVKGPAALSKVRGTTTKTHPGFDPRHRATDPYLPVLVGDRRSSCMRVATHVGGHAAVAFVNMIAGRVLSPAPKPHMPL